MMVSMEKIIPNKIYFSSSLQINVEKEGKYILTSTDPEDPQRLKSLTDSMKFVPQGKMYLYFPEMLLNPATLASISSTKERNDFFKDIAEINLGHQATKVMKLSDLSQEQKSDNHPLVVNVGGYFSKLDSYISVHKKTPQQKYAYLKLVLKKILADTARDIPEGKKTLVVDIQGNSPRIDPVLFTIVYGLKKDFEGCSGIFSGVDVILVDPDHNLFVKLNLTDRKKAIQSVNLSAKMAALSKSFDPKKVITDKDVQVGDTVVSDDAEVIGSTEETPIDKTGEVTNQEAAKASEQTKEEADHTDVDGVSRVEDLDLSEIMATDTSAEFDRLEKENAEFVAKFKPQQDKAFGDVQKREEDFVLHVESAKDDAVLNPSIKTAKTVALTNSYHKNLFRKDVASLLQSLNNDSEFPAVVISHEMKDSSDPLNLKDELSVVFMDKQGKKHNFTVDVPKLSSDGFLYINGNKKFIAKQTTLLPLIKEAPDRVQITTSYSKTFLYRKGDKTNPMIDRIFKTLIGKSYTGVKPMYGNSFASNIKYGVSIPYNYLSKRLFTLSFDLGAKASLDFHFSQKRIRSVMEDAGMSIPEGKLPVALRMMNGKIDAVYFEDASTRKVEQVSGKTVMKTYQNLQDLLVETIRNYKNTDVLKAFEATNAGKAYSYTDIKLAGTSVPLGILVSFYQGLLPALDGYGIKYTVSAEKRRAAENETLIQFKDMNVYLNLEGDTAKELFANGLYFLNTKEFSYRDAERRGSVFIEYFGEAIGSRNIAKAYINFETSMIDPITKEILIDLKLPTEFVPLLYKANDMLAGYSHKRKNDMTNFRVRDSEVLSVAIYDVLMKSFNEYKRTVKTGVVTPISAPKDAVVKKVQALPNVEDYSVLSPFLEMELKSKTTFKGPSGLNSSDAYTAEIRSYDPSMIGLFGIFSPVSGEIGVNRSLVLNPKIRNNRGYLDHPDVDSMNMDNLFASGELLNLFSANHSDPMRTGMATTQGKHIVSTKVQHNYLIGTGLDKTISQLIGQDFAWKAAEDGEIVKIDQRNKLVFVKYKTGQTTAIDVSDKPAKNSSSGFWIKNKLELIDGLKVGSKFKKGQTLATNRSFFRQDMDGSHGFAPGRLTKVAMMCLPTTYEDSAPVIEKVAKEMASDIITEKQVALKENSKIIKIASEGQKLNVNDPLIIFEEIGDSEKDALSAIEKAAKAAEGDEDLEHLGRNIIKSKYSGTITNVKVYYNCDLESDAIHPTLKEYVKGYISKVKSRSDALKGNKEDDLIEMPSIERIDSDKILGNEMSGVLIVFYIAHEEKMDVGNKLAFFSACKGIVSEVIPDDLAPLTEYREEEPIEAVVSPMSLISRNTPDLPLMGFSNKVILELKKQCIEELFGDKK